MEEAVEETEEIVMPSLVLEILDTITSIHKIRTPLATTQDIL